VNSYVYMGATPPQFSPRLSFAPKAFSAAQLREGHDYMVSQWRQSGVLAAKAGAFKKPTAVKKADGKVAVPITSFLTDWNKQAAEVLRPVMRALRNVPMPSFIDKRKLENRPIDFILDVFNPVFDRFEAACVRTQRQHVPRGKVEWFGKTIDIRIDQPGDERMDASTRGFVRKMRIIQSFILLFFTKPIELAGECLKEGVDLAGDVARDVGKAVDDTLKQAGKTAQAAAQEAQKAVAGAVDWFKSVTGLGAYGGTYGLGATGVEEGGAVGVVGVGGVGIEQVVQQIIEKIMQALSEKAPEIASNLVQTAATKGIESAFAPPPTPAEEAAVVAAAAAPAAPVVVTVPGGAVSTAPSLPPYVIPLGIAAALGIGFLALRK
jgi:hypothetical protein